MGLLIEKYIGKTGRKLFLLFCWLFTLIVIAAFADMVAGTFNAYTVNGRRYRAFRRQHRQTAQPVPFPCYSSYLQWYLAYCRRSSTWTGWKETVVGLACTVAALGNRYGISR